MPGDRVLICGAGVAGSVLAYWLGRYGFQVTVVERSRVEQKLGQGVEIEEPALQVVKAMGVLDKLEARRTDETGFQLMDERGQNYGTLGLGGFSPAGSLELMRGDLTEVLYRAADELQNVTYRFESTIKTLRQSAERVIVEIEQRRESSSGGDEEEEFDFVIGADGVKSRTRDLAFGTPAVLGCYHPVGSFGAYFSIPEQPQDTPYSRLLHSSGRRALCLRPVVKGSGRTSAYLINMNTDIENLRRAQRTGDRAVQKEAWAKAYSDVGWEAPRVIEALMRSDNFYSDELVQVKLASWSRGRVALIGDAAWAPTNFTGYGNQLAIMGAWVLAQEMSRDSSTAAFLSYDKRFRKLVESSQEIPLNGYGPKLFLPDTDLGIWMFRNIGMIVIWVVHLVEWTKVATLFPGDKKNDVFALEMDKVFQLEEQKMISR